MSTIIDYLLFLPGILIAITFHEFSHGWVSDRLGDPTPRSQGRLSLNPMRHLDPIGFLMLLIVHFGWAKPVQINPQYYKKPRRDEILVSIAGVTMNIIIAIIFTGIFKIFIEISFSNNWIYELSGQYYSSSTSFSNSFVIIKNLLLNTIYINIVLCLFNLIPLPPLDGSHILFNIFNIQHTKAAYFLERYGMFILIGFFILPSFLGLGFSLFDYTITPAINGILKFLLWIFSIPQGLFKF